MIFIVITVLWTEKKDKGGYTITKKGIGLEGYILINADTKRSQYWCITKEAIKIKGVKMAHMVLGGFDAVFYINFLDSDDLKRIISEVTSIQAVERIQTMLALLPKERLEI